MTATAILYPAKVCTTCGKSKDLTAFTKKSTGKFGVGCVCSLCRKDYRKAYQIANVDKLREAAKIFYEKNRAACNERSRLYWEKNKDSCNAKQKAYNIKNSELIAAKNAIRYVANKEQIQEKAAEWRAANADIHRARAKSYRERNTSKVNAYLNKRYQSDPLHALKVSMRNLVGLTFRRNGYSKKSKTHDILGCDWDTFKGHIERQFHKGMNWTNRGDWHFDHIIPIATAKTEGEVLALNHFTNLRPMWAKDNLSKGAQITHLI